MVPLLAICIPTYNRLHHLVEVLEMLDGELAGRDDVMVLVSDNCSTDGTPEFLTEAVATRPWLETHRQDENLGATGNVKWLIENVPDVGYTWIYGDDDRLEPGSLAGIAEILRKERPLWLHLPHHFIGEAGNLVDSSPAPGRVERHGSAGELWNAYHHWLTFVTAQIVRADALRPAPAQGGYDSGFAPFIWFFRAALEGGPCVVAPDHVIRASLGISWSDKADVYLTKDYVGIYDEIVHKRVSAEDFGRSLNGLYKRDGWALEHWRRVPIEWLEDAVRRFPHSENLRSYLWTVARERGAAETLPVLADAARVTGAETHARELVTTGEAAFAEGDIHAAARWFHSATEAAPTLAAAWNDLAVALHHLGDYRAAGAVEAALFVVPDDVDALVNRGSILLARGQRDGAAADALRAIELDPGNDAAAELLAVVSG